VFAPEDAPDKRPSLLPDGNNQFSTGARRQHTGNAVSGSKHAILDSPGWGGQMVGDSSPCRAETLSFEVMPSVCSCQLVGDLSLSRIGSREPRSIAENCVCANDDWGGNVGLGRRNRLVKRSLVAAGDNVSEHSENGSICCFGPFRRRKNRASRLCNGPYERMSASNELDLTERRSCPNEGVICTFVELKESYASEVSDEDLKAYWRDACVPV